MDIPLFVWFEAEVALDKGGKEVVIEDEELTVFIVIGVVVEAVIWAEIRTQDRLRLRCS